MVQLKALAIALAIAALALCAPDNSAQAQQTVESR